VRMTKAGQSSNRPIRLLQCSDPGGTKIEFVLDARASLLQEVPCRLSGMQRASQRAELRLSTRIELVHSLFGNEFPMLIMSILFIATSILCASHDPQPWMLRLGLAGACLSVLRVAIFYVLRRRLAEETSVNKINQIEVAFGSVYLGFACLLGLFAALGLLTCKPEEQSLFIALVVGYAAGVAAAVSLRPWIAFPAILMAVLPCVVASLMLQDLMHALLAMVLLALLFGGFTSILSRYRAAVEAIEARHLLSAMARSDVLTGLANRLALQDAFRREVELGHGQSLAIHVLDLDDFKPVNDVHGHQFGDLLLAEVGSRLRSVVRGREMPIRLGGDEFAYLQPAVEHRDEVELMARRLRKLIAEPYILAGRPIEVGVSAGSAMVRDSGPILERLIETADAALYRDKARHHLAFGLNSASA